MSRYTFYLKEDIVLRLTPEGELQVYWGEGEGWNGPYPERGKDLLMSLPELTVDEAAYAMSADNDVTIAKAKEMLFEE